MNEDLTMERMNSARYTLFQFLTIKSEGDIASVELKRNCWGEDFSIEEAFNAAKALVTRDYEALRDRLAKEGKLENSKLTIEETEFGYDLRHDFFAVSRYWIHGS